MPVDFNDLFKNIKDAVVVAAGDSVKDYADWAKKDGLAFLESSKDKLKTWTGLLESGALTPDEFKLLVNSQKDLMQMEFLKDKGISKIKINKAKNNIIEAVIKVVLQYLPMLLG
jgi:hypothetical protein